MGHYIYKYKSAITGQWVTEAYALKNPKTTIKIRVLVP
jgi:hypothetical protein